MHQYHLPSATFVLLSHLFNRFVCQDGNRWFGGHTQLLFLRDGYAALIFHHHVVLHLGGGTTRATVDVVVKNMSTAREMRRQKSSGHRAASLTFACGFDGSRAARSACSC